MSSQKYLIDTNVFIGLEDTREVHPEFATLLQLTSKHGIGVFVHEAARDDIARDKDSARRKVSLSKVRKFQLLSKVRDLSKDELELQFGALPRPNDVVDATLLHALDLGVADFLVTQDRGLHERARRHAPALTRRILYVADAVSLLRSTYEPVDVPLRYVEELDAHAIPLAHPIFDSLREGYPDFDRWWKKCVRQMRKCWIVTDDGDLAGIVVRKDEEEGDTDARTKAAKILKICTFKVRPEYRGIKLGELLLKQVLWFAQTNRYDLVYVTTYSDQDTLIELLQYFGFKHTYSKPDGEQVYEKPFSRGALTPSRGQDLFEAARLNYPRFVTAARVSGYCIPIREAYHESLFPELADWTSKAIGEGAPGLGPRTPGNTIRKVYLCRAPVEIDEPGAILAFYKGKSQGAPSQAVTTLGIFEDMRLAHSTEELIRLAGHRSVYSEQQLVDFKASLYRPVKVINFLLAGHVEPAISYQELLAEGVLRGFPQSICRLDHDQLRAIFHRARLGFRL